MLNWADPPRYAPRVSRACSTGGVSGGVVAGRSWPVGRVDWSLRTAAIMFFTAVYDLSLIHI